MAMNPTVDRSRPLLRAPDLRWVKRLNWRYFMQRLPMLLLAVPAAYGVGAFADDKLPLLVAIFAGAGYESCYLGAVALADQQYDAKDTKSTALWWSLNLMAVASSIVTNTLFFAGGHYADITPEAVTHGAPMAMLAFMYGLVLHRSAVKQASRVQCVRCEAWFDSRQAYNGHLRTCK